MDPEWEWIYRLLQSTVFNRKNQVEALTKLKMTEFLERFRTPNDLRSWQEIEELAR